jgi:D-alanine-D-alanine ligase-like ATP-grasp enzyme
MKKEPARPLLGVVLEKIAPSIGAHVSMEPEWNIVGQITFKDGRNRYFRYSSLDINSLGAALLAKDKDYANYFMDSMGYPTIPGRTFYSNDWAKALGSKENIHAAYRYAKKIGFPVIVKPNDGSQGSGVFLADNKKEFYKGLKEIFKKTQVALVQDYVKGHDYRIVVLDDEVVMAYERIPLSVIGDGRSSIKTLLKVKAAEFKGSSKDVRIVPNDPRILQKLARQELSLKSVPEEGEQIFLLDNANLSSGGEAIDVTTVVHQGFVELAIDLTKDMGLRLCGVDLLVDGDISLRPAKFVVLEVNASPGLDHYAKLGKTQQMLVEALYLEVLKRMEKMP